MRRFTIVALVVSILASTALGQAPHVGYQGELRKDNQLYSGAAQMKFAIVSNGQTLWSNDGTSTTGDQPAASVAVTIGGGLFGVHLGATPMMPIPASNLQGVTNASLRVWVDTGEGFEQLSDQPIGSSSFALASEKTRFIHTSDVGAVGIGTATPGTKLDVVASGSPAEVFGAVMRFVNSGTPDSRATLSLQAGSGEFAGIHLGSPAAPIRGFIGYNNANDLLQINAGGGARLFVTGVGNVGIGTNVPTEALDVAGNVRCASLIQTSSRRFKTDVKPLSNALDTLRRLEGVSFRWDATHGGEADIGFVAEDVAHVLPELVRCEPDGTNAIGLKYDHITAVAVEAIKEQQAQIDSMKAELADRDRRIGELSARLAALEAVTMRSPSPRQ